MKGVNLLTHARRRSEVTFENPSLEKAGKPRLDFTRNRPLEIIYNREYKTNNNKKPLYWKFTSEMERLKNVKKTYGLMN